MLATDQLIKKSYSGSMVTNLTSLIPNLWAATLERNLRIRAVLQQSIVENTDLMVPNSGQTIYIPTLKDFTGTMASLTEGTDITVDALNTASTVAYTPTEYGKLVGITRKALDRIKYDGVAAVVDRLAYLASRTVETQIANLYSANVPGTSGSGFANGQLTTEYTLSHTDVSNSNWGGTPTTTANIAATDVFNDELILRGVQVLQGFNNIPFPDGYYRLFISPIQYKALMLDTNTRQDLRFGAPQTLFTGEVGALHGCRIIVTNSIQTDTEDTSVTVQNALLVAPRWAAVAWKRRPAVVIDPTLYDLGRRRQFGVVGDWDIELLHNDRAVVLKSA
jgi:N4-gp56 family major capsid protein